MKSKSPLIPQEADHIARARQGDKEAYRALVEGYQDRLYGMILSMTRNPQTAEDLTQEVFVKAYFALASFKGDSAFYTWLFRIASNHCLDHLRKNRPLEIPLDHESEDEDRLSLHQTLEAPSSEHPDTPLESEGEVSRLLLSLDPDQRLILSLREVQGHSYEEMASMLNCGVNTIKSRLNRAREALKQAYLEKFGPPLGRAGRPPESVADGNILEMKNVQKSEEI